VQLQVHVAETLFHCCHTDRHMQTIALGRHGVLSQNK
jgi:hypothetical protein